MERIKQQVDHLQQHLAGLSLGQKALTAVLVAIMLGTVVWWVHRATMDDTVALFDQPLTDRQSREIRELLTAEGIETQVMGTHLYVSADQRPAALGLLARERLYVQSDDLSESFSGLDIFATRQRTELMEQNALERRLGTRMAGWNGVRSASVTLNRVYRRQIGESLLPSAAVDLSTIGTPDLRQIADAARQLAASSVSGLKPENVTVVIDGRPMDTGAPRGGNPLLTLRADAEHYFVGVVRNALPQIPGLAVTVAVDMQAAAGSVASEETGSGSSGELASLLDVVLPASGGSARPNEPRWIVEEPPAMPASASHVPIPTPVGCAISVPMSWLIQQWQVRAQTDLLPDAAELREFEALKLAELRQRVRMSLGDITEEQILVAVDADSAFPVSQPAIGGDGEDGAGISALLRDYGREIAIGVLAAVSVLLATTMVKKGGVLAMSGPSLLDSGSSFAAAGELGLVEGQLDALTGQAGEMLDQVQSLVREHPDEAASLVQRWLAAN